MSLSVLQASLLEELLSLQQQLPPSLLQLPSAEDHHSAGAVLQFYQQQLSSALQDHATCAAALGSLQRIGNCLALLHLLSIQQAVWATPQFMQVQQGPQHEVALYGWKGVCGMRFLHLPIICGSQVTRFCNKRPYHSNTHSHAGKLLVSHMPNTQYVC